MLDNHPDQEVLERFMLGRCSRQENLRVVRHLLTECAACKQVTGQLWSLPRHSAPHHAAVGYGGDSRCPDSNPDHYDVVFERVLDQVCGKEVVLAQERSRAPQLFQEFEKHPPARRLLLARNSRRFQSWSLCELVLEKTLESCFHEPAKAVELGALGVVIAENLSDADYSPALANDMRARAWFYLGNARRVTSDLAGAMEAMQEAEGYLTQGSGDPLEEGRFLDCRACLLSDQGHYQEAIRLESRAIRCFKLIGDDQLVGKSLVHMAVSCGHAGEPERAIPLLRRALAILDPSVDPRMVVATKHNLIFFLRAAGELEEALSLLREVRSFHVKLGHRMDLIRLKWTEGRIAQDLKQPRVAELAFLEVRKTFLEHRIGYDAALVSLDLATLYLEQNRNDEVKALAEEMLPIFESHDVHREAMAALAVFQQAVEVDKVTLNLVAKLSDYLEKARENPELTFQPPS